MINGYKLIKEPKPIPGQIDPVPIFTWGEIAATPNLLNPAKKFNMQQSSERENIGYSLANKNAKMKKMKEQEKM